MQLFYKLVIYVAIAILILTLGFIALYHSSETSAFPQYLSKCPDYWIQNENGTCSVVVGGSGSNSSINSLKAKYNYLTDKHLRNIKVTPPSELDKHYNQDNQTFTFDFNRNTWCDNRKWCQTNDIFWDGVTNVRIPNLSC
jgi:hypothetical protein